MSQRPIDNQATKSYFRLAAAVPLNMELPGEPARPPVQLRYLAKRRSPKKALIRAAAFASVIVLLAGGLLIAQNYFKIQKVFRGDASQASALSAAVNPNLLKGESTGRVNLLILGEDGPGHKNAMVTNTMIFVSIDTINHQASILSLPNNLWVTVPQQGVMTLNQTWQSSLGHIGDNKSLSSLSNQSINSAFQLTDQTVEDVINQPIDYNVIVNYQALSQTVNQLGGLSINVPTTLNDPTIAWQNKGNPVIANAGQQTMTGDQTLNYVSSKETTSEVDRSNRQQAVLVALMNQIISLGTLSNPLKLSALLTTLGNSVSTDLSLDNGARLYGILSNINTSDVASLNIINNPNLTTGGNVDGQAVVLPTSGLFNYQAIQTYLASQLKNPYIIKENAKILVLNGTNTAGLASGAANQLKNAGFNVLEAGNTPSSGWTSSSLIDLTHDHNLTKKALEGWFHVKAANHLSDNSIPTDGADFVIIIGSNATTSN